MMVPWCVEFRICDFNVLRRNDVILANISVTDRSINSTLLCFAFECCCCLFVYQVPFEELSYFVFLDQNNTQTKQTCAASGVFSAAMSIVTNKFKVAFRSPTAVPIASDSRMSSIIQTALSAFTAWPLWTTWTVCSPSESLPCLTSGWFTTAKSTTTRR